MLMVDLEVISMVRDIVTILGVIGGFTYYVMTVRATQRNQKQQLETRQAQLFMNIYNQWTSGINRNFSELRNWEWNNYDDYIKKYGDIESQNEVSNVGGYLEGIGVLVKENYVPIRLVALFLTTVVMDFYEQFESITKENRKRRNAPRIGSESEYLYKTLHKYLEENPNIHG